MWKRIFSDKESAKKMELLNEMKNDGGKEVAFHSSLDVHPPSFPLYASSLSADVFTDVELIKSFTGSAVDSVFYSIDNSWLKGSKTFFQRLLTQPIHCIDTLKTRQSILRQISRDELFNQIDEQLEIMKEGEDAMMWMYTHDQHTEEIANLYNMVYFNFILLKPLNLQSQALTCFNLYKIVASPLIGVFSPIFYVILPFLVLQIKLRAGGGNGSVSFMEYIKFAIKELVQGGGVVTQLFPSLKKLSYVYYAFSLLFYFQGLFNSVEVAKVVYNITSFLTDKMDKVCKYVRAAEKVDTLLSSKGVSLHPFMEGGRVAGSCKDEFIDWPASPSRYLLFTDFGRHLKHFKSFDKAAYAPLIQRMFVVDTLISIIKMNKTKGFCYPTYVLTPDNLLASTSKPYVRCEGMWHPSLNSSNVVKNDVEVDKSIVITGPNAGGKSTLLKSVLLSVLFSQSIGVANCDSITLTPMVYIGSQMNIPDCKGKESLFEAEMYRSKANVDVVKKLNDGIGGNKFSILFMDEIFNSTNPVEGIAGAYAIAKNIAQYPNNISIITTHYLYLTKLAKDQPYKNLKMNVNIGTNQNKNKLEKGLDNDNVSISYPYKVSPGVSRQYIAIELLNENGFDKAIVKDAMEIKRRLLAPVSEKKTCVSK